MSTQSEDEQISTLMNMGFADFAEVRRALRLAKNDVNEAVAILTDNPSGSYGPMDVQDSDYVQNTTLTLSPKQVNQSSEPCTDGPTNTLEFPAIHLYELEGRVFTDTWSIPYKKEESLGKCLIAAARLAGAGLSEADENCRRFSNRCMPESFKKLLTTMAVRRWSVDIQEGIYNMVMLLVDFVIAKLSNDAPLTSNAVYVSFQMVFDLDTEWNVKNKGKKSQVNWETVFSNKQPFAVSPGHLSFKEPYGWTVDVVNRFGESGGFDHIKRLFESFYMTAADMASLLQPWAFCAELLNPVAISPVLSPCFEVAVTYVTSISDDDLKKKDISTISELFNALRQLSVSLWPAHVERIVQLRLEIVLRMLRSPHFNARMNGLKEVSKLIDDAGSAKNGKATLDSDKLLEWLSDNRVLSISLEGNIDQVQYVDRIKAIVEFLGPKLSLDDLTKIWKMQEGQNNLVVDNIYSIMAAASAKFSSTQFDHLFTLIQKNWQEENDRMRERLLSLIGKIGREARPGKISTKVLDLLWDLSHLPSLPTHLVEHALDEHTNILSDPAFKDTVRRTYICKCIDDLKKGNSGCVLPALIQLNKIARAIAKPGVLKQDKALLSDLAKNHELIKLVSASLTRCHKMSVAATATANMSLTPDFYVDSRYSHADYMHSHLCFLQFLLQEFDLYLAWNRCKDLWDTLIGNPDACEYDRDTCHEWFRTSINDIEFEVQGQLFREKLLRMDPALVSLSAFHCLRAFFENVNIHVEHRVRRLANTLVVDKLDLVGIDYFWQVALFSPSEDIATLSTDIILDLSYAGLNIKLKKDPIQLHKKFITDCYKRLGETAMLLTGTAMSTAVSSATKTLTAVSVSEVATLPLPSRSAKILNTCRLLQIIERYISTVEAGHHTPRSLLPHAASFHGYPVSVHCVMDGASASKTEFTIQSHSNDTLHSLKYKIGLRIKRNADNIQVVVGEQSYGHNKDHKLLEQLEFEDDQRVQVKIVGMGSSLAGPGLMLGLNSSGALSAVSGPVGGSSSSMDTGCVSESSFGASSAAACNSEDSALASNESASKQSAYGEGEKQLPGVVMCQDGHAFDLIYQLAELEDQKISCRIRTLLRLIPSDPAIQDSLDSVTSKDTSSAATYRGNLSSPALVISCDNSPRGSPHPSPKRMPSSSVSSVSSVTSATLGPSAGEANGSREILKNLFDPSAPNMSTFRVLYNLEVLSGKLLPTVNDIGTVQSARVFREEFLACGGLPLIINILQKDALLADMDSETRQGCCFIALQLARYLLCGQLSAGADNPIMCASSAMSISDSAFLGSGTGSRTLSTASSSSLKTIQTLTHNEFVDCVLCLMRVAWAAAAGRLNIACSLHPAQAQAGDVPTLFMSTQSRKSSTGSNASSTGSEGDVGPGSLHAGTLTGQLKKVGPRDVLIAKEALEFLVTCIQLRSDLILVFYNTTYVGDFVIDMLLGSSSNEIRAKACEQFYQLAQIPLTDDTLVDVSRAVITPRHFILQLLIKAHLPLWVSTSNTRGASQRLLSQCTEFFDLLCHLLANLSFDEQKSLSVNASQMLDDEVAWLGNFTPSKLNAALGEIDTCLLTGHLKLARTLLTCERVDKTAAGKALTDDLVDGFLFPASRLISENKIMQVPNGINFMPKCASIVSRVAAYELLIELCTNCPVNLEKLARRLIQMHHFFNPVNTREFEYEPAITARATCGFVGLKNAGATCYMNSVIQQLFMVPALPEAILAMDLEEDNQEESMFFQFQTVLGALLDSQLEYFEPVRFWNCFKLWGQPVNVREQQDAFEFFTHLVDQIDETLIKHKKDPIFKLTFEGVFSDQKLCQDCLHSYEREEPFIALNLTVKSHNLEDSLIQFVNGELLEGDNAYLCEKCSEKRNAVKRTCIKSLPRVLVIQLKRFGYDWEANRALKFDDHFKFPWRLDMYPYTAEGLANQPISYHTLKKNNSLLSSPTISSIPELQSSILSQSAPEPSFFSTSSPSRVSSFSPSFVTTSHTTPRPGFVVGAGRKRPQMNYELVGVIVHSGQASAGHYYSFIKDRRGDVVSNPNMKKWFKFNDTSVEEFDMNDHTVESECFGGTYQAKVSDNASSSFPEVRQRYWNAYLLVYERVDDVLSTPRLPRRSISMVATRRSLRKSEDVSSAQRLSHSRSLASERRPMNDGLNALTLLVKHGEKRGLFGERMPAKIQHSLQQQNLQFMQNRDIYANDYVDFIGELANRNSAVSASGSAQVVSALKLGVHFLFNTYFRTKRKQKVVVDKWVETIDLLVNSCLDASRWLINFFATAEGMTYLRLFLFECPSKEIRFTFACIIQKAVSAFFRLGGQTVDPGLDNLVKNLLSLLIKDVPDNLKNCGQYFWLLQHYIQSGSKAAVHLMQRGAFGQLLRIFVGDSPTNDDEFASSRNWNSNQEWDFTGLHTTLATLILSCDLTPFRSCTPLPNTAEPKGIYNYDLKLPITPDIESALFGDASDRYLREVVVSYKEMRGTASILVEMMTFVSFCNADFSMKLLKHILYQCSTVASNEVKNLTNLLMNILLMEDPLQFARIERVADGSKESTGLGYDGLLTVIRSNHITDSRRSYQMIKFLVQLANKCAVAKDHLTQNPSKWQWSVNWLKKKMAELSGNAGGSVTTVSGQAWSNSNEDSNTKAFQRTISAQDTLDEATALLIDFDRDLVDMEDEIMEEVQEVCMMADTEDNNMN